MNLDEKITPTSEAMSRMLGDEAVLLHLGSGTYYGLDAVGTRIWQLIGEGMTPSQICDVLVKEYDVPRERLENDMQVLIKELLEHRLVNRAEE